MMPVPMPFISNHLFLSRYKARCQQLEQELKDLKVKEEELIRAKKEIRALQMLNYGLQHKVMKFIEGK